MCQEDISMLIWFDCGGPSALKDMDSVAALIIPTHDGVFLAPSMPRVKIVNTRNERGPGLHLHEQWTDMQGCV